MDDRPDGQDDELDMWAREVGGELPIDPGIAWAVKVLRDGGVETCESCEGGPGHAFPEPTVQFFGERPAGWAALAAAQDAGLPVLYLRRVWPILDGEPSAPVWELVFREAVRDLRSAPEHEGCNYLGFWNEDRTMWFCEKCGQAGGA